MCIRCRVCVCVSHTFIADALTGRSRLLLTLEAGALDPSRSNRACFMGLRAGPVRFGIPMLWPPQPQSPAHTLVRSLRRLSIVGHCFHLFVLAQCACFAVVRGRRPPATAQTARRRRAGAASRESRALLLAISLAKREAQLSRWHRFQTRRLACSHQRVHHLEFDTAPAAMWCGAERDSSAPALSFIKPSRHVLNAQVSIRAPCCKKWFDARL